MGVVAPAGPFRPKDLKKGLAVLKQMGFQTVLPEGLFGKDGYLAGPDGHRVDLLHRFFADAAVDGIICARGGYGSLRILPALDFDLIRANPKPFIGFSDVTALLNPMFLKGGLVTFHGPVVTTVADACGKTRKALASALAGPAGLEIFSSRPRILRPGRAEGIFLGGNLTTLCHLVGTPFQPRFRDSVLLFEDKGEALYRIDRMLTQMQMAGCFAGVSGIALGSFVDCGRPKDVHEIFRNCFKKSKIPILGGFEIGHGKVNRAVPIGSPVVLDTNRGSLGFLQP